MEIRVINSSTIPRKPEWKKLFLEKVQQFRPGTNGDKLDTIMLVFKKDENFDGAVTAWNRLCKKEFKKIPRIQQRSHVLGTTLYFSME